MVIKSKSDSEVKKTKSTFVPVIHFISSFTEKKRFSVPRLRMIPEIFAACPVKFASKINRNNGWL